MGYLDFSLRVRRRSRGELVAEVLDSPAGQASALVPALPAADLRRGFEALACGGQEAFRHLAGVGRGPAEHPSGAAEVGASLFDAVFQGAVRQCFDESVGAARAAGGLGLRIKVHQAPDEPVERELALLPWELLYRRSRRRFLALQRTTPVVRFLEVAEPQPHLPLPYPLRIAVVKSAPRDMAPLALERELAALRASWSRCAGVDVRCFEATSAGLRRAVVDHGCHVLHFMGHGVYTPGTGRGSLVLENPGGAAAEIGATELRTLLQGGEHLRLAVLNACASGRTSSDHRHDVFEGIAHSLVFGGVPAVVAMSLPVEDRSAVQFGRRLYERLAAGDPLDAAVTEGRHAIRQLNGLVAAWAVPAVFTRVPDLTLFSPLPGIEGTDEARRLFDKGLALFEASDFPGALKRFVAASRCSEGFEKAQIYACLAAMARTSPSSLERSEARRLNDRLSRLIDSKSPEVAALAVGALGLLRYDHFHQKRVKTEGPTSAELLDRIRRRPLTLDQRRVLSSLRYTPAAGAPLGLPPRRESR